MRAIMPMRALLRTAGHGLLVLHGRHVEWLHGLDLSVLVLAHERHESPVHAQYYEHLQVLVRQEFAAVVQHGVRAGDDEHREELRTSQRAGIIERDTQRTGGY